MHQLMPSINPFFEIGIQRNYLGHQGFYPLFLERL